jgi:DNA-binding transcriptional MerR regulator
MDKQGQIAFDFFGTSMEEDSSVQATKDKESTSLHSVTSITPERKLVPPAQVEIKEEVKSEPLIIKEEKAEFEKETDADSNNNQQTVPGDISETLNTFNIPSFENPPQPEIEIVAVEPTDDVIDFNIIKFEADETAPDQNSSKSTRGRKSIKSYDKDADLPEIPANESDFTKQYYSIGEVALMFKVNASLLRFWETEFDIIQPRKNKKGDRHFRPVDIKNLELIYDLLRRRKLTIEGAKEYLKSNKRSREKYEMIKSLENLKSFLLEIKANL